jgi:hypothetical protein
MKEQIETVLEIQKELEELLAEQSLLIEKIEIAEQKFSSAKCDLAKAMPDCNCYLYRDNVIQKDNDGFIVIVKVHQIY